MRSPAFLIKFNRPERARQVFDRIRRARPPRLYVAADGARASRPDEADRCPEREIATAVDWPRHCMEVEAAAVADRWTRCHVFGVGENHVPLKRVRLALSSILGRLRAG